MRNTYQARRLSGPVRNLNIWRTQATGNFTGKYSLNWKKGWGPLQWTYLRPGQMLNCQPIAAWSSYSISFRQENSIEHWTHTHCYHRPIYYSKFGQLILSEAQLNVSYLESLKYNFRFLKDYSNLMRRMNRMRRRRITGSNIVSHPLSTHVVYWQCLCFQVMEDQKEYSTWFNVYIYGDSCNFKGHVHVTWLAMSLFVTCLISLQQLHLAMFENEILLIPAWVPFFFHQ